MKISHGPWERFYDPSIETDGKREQWYINDHCIVKAQDGMWHMFGITGPEPFNPLEEKFFAHATAKNLTDKNWTRQEHVMHYSPEHGEGIVWAPCVHYHDGLYYMYYCGGSTKLGVADGKSVGGDIFRIQLATSKDLYDWERHPANPMLIDGWAARDPFVKRIGDEWVMYYTCTSTPQGGNYCVAAVTSKDLITWGNKRNVFVHEMTGKDGGPCESPYVVKHKDSYLLLIGPYGPSYRDDYAKTAVFRSDDPFNFKAENQVGLITAHAGELILDDDGQYYATHCGWMQDGLFIAPVTIED